VLVALLDHPDNLSEAKTHALAFAASKTWRRVWDALIGDYLTLHARRPSPPRQPLSRIGITAR